MNSLISLFRIPTEIIYGFGSIKKVGEVVSNLAASPVLVVTDHGVREAGLLDLVLEPLRDSGVKYEIFADVEPNPSVDTVGKGLHLLKKSGCQAIVAVGGGSPLDTGKAIGLLAANGGSILDYEGADRVPANSLPLVAIPTTAGTASEVTINIVITDHSRNYKLTIVSTRAAARAAILDPLMTRSMPPKLTAATGLDALVHAIESYTSLMAYPLTEALALESVRLISEHLRPAVFNGNNLAARDAMLMGSLLAGLAFNNTRLGNAHAMSHPLSAYSDIPHGVANAILIPHIMEYNVPACPGRFARIAAVMGVRTEGLTTMEAAYAAVAAVWKLNDCVGIPKSMGEVGAEKDLIPAMARDAMKSGNILVNPRTTVIDDIINLYEKAF
ncbi:MAG: iron-containing alcohol dehydrogenase [Eubacteriales bacterium]